MAFATAEDVATRLGRELTADEEATAELVIELTTGLIETAANENAAWSAALVPVPKLFTILCLERAVRTILNPTGAASLSKTLGQFSYSETRPRAEDLGLLLTEGEERLVRRALGKPPSTSSRPKSVIGDFLPES